MGKMFNDFNQYPEAKKFNAGQKMTITLYGTAEFVSSSGVQMCIESFKLGKKGKMNTQEILLNNMNNRLKNWPPQ